MSKPKEIWWGYVKAVIRKYPERTQMLEDLRSVTLTANLSGMPCGGNASRSTENVALRSLPENEQREYDAVRCAIMQTMQLGTSDARMRIVELVFWEGGYNLTSAARKTGYSYDTAQNYHKDFIWLVAKNLGLCKNVPTRAKKV